MQVLDVKRSTKSKQYLKSAADLPRKCKSPTSACTRSKGACILNKVERSMSSLFETNSALIGMEYSSRLLKSPLFPNE